MKPYFALFVLFLVSLAFTQGALAAHGVAKLDPIENKTLASSDDMPVWTRGAVNYFCEGRLQTIHENKNQCKKAHADKIGSKMTPADVEEMQGFKKRGIVAAKRVHRQSSWQGSRRAMRWAGQTVNI